jgi:hypothetical protein
MKRILLYFVLIFSGPVYAEWVSVTSSADGSNKFYIESTSVKKSGSYLRAWGLTDYAKRNEYGSKSHKTYYEIDCNDSRIRSISYTFYTENMGRGEANSYNPEKFEWVYASPDSINSYIVGYVCAPRWN